MVVSVLKSKVVKALEWDGCPWSGVSRLIRKVGMQEVTVDDIFQGRGIVLLYIFSEVDLLYPETR